MSDVNLAPADVCLLEVGKKEADEDIEGVYKSDH